ASLNGLLHERLQDIPQEGDKIEIEELRIVVDKVSKNIPKKIRIEKIKN
ncbi:MAG: hemolysin, partial [Thaumarchaeota archaeon]|nr:hemolysin [Nitrososphaerota archaeon]